MYGFQLLATFLQAFVHIRYIKYQAVIIVMIRYALCNSLYQKHDVVDVPGRQSWRCYFYCRVIILHNVECSWLPQFLRARVLKLRTNACVDIMSVTAVDAFNLETTTYYSQPQIYYKPPNII